MKRVIIAFGKWDEQLAQKATRLGFREFLVGSLEQAPRDAIIYLEESGRRLKLTADGRRVDVPVVHVKKPTDLERVVELGKAGAGEVHVRAGDWKIIPLENLIAMKRGLKIDVIAETSSPSEVELMFGILEQGVDGVVVRVANEDELELLNDVAKAPTQLKLDEAVVEEIKDVGMGDRVCVDTVSVLEYGEGLLVGSMARMFFLIHNESVGSAFTSPRPFRVNAGAVHSYVLMPDGKTKYLSEIGAGDRVLVVSSKGKTRIAAVGRAKVERRPMRLVRARVGESWGAVTVQNAETIRFITPDHRLIPVTELKEGDRILCHIAPEKARHFGMAVDEMIIER